MKDIYLLALLSTILFFNSCGGGEDTKKKEQQVQLLLYLQNNKSANSTTQASCFNFTSTESTCIVLPDSQSTVCSDSELTRLKNGIQPSDKRTDSILIGFFGCWKNCALLFNATNSTCTGSKYPTTKTYRDAQKSTSTTASAAWGTCMTTCNNGNSEETGLKGTGATYPTQPF
jgi:hypothetical protein